MDEATKMPALFVGHGSPMNTLENNRYTDAWRDFGSNTPKPRAILAISAHWYTTYTAVTAMAHPRTIHDFAGFPDELFAVQYPAPGSPELAEEVADLAAPTSVGRDTGWGLDHGTWSVLVHMYPDADIPVAQLSIDARQRPEFHVELGARLAPLRERGVLIVASGNVVHNLGRIRPQYPDAGEDWARRFDAAAIELMTQRPRDIAELIGHHDYRAAAPTPEHLLPLYYLAGLAYADGRGADVLVEGCALGSLSMTSYVVGRA